MAWNSPASRSQAPRLGLVLSGGGARGMAHVGVLRALQHIGCEPSVLVGVSMGSVVAATYALNPGWYAALRDMDVSGFPELPDFSQTGMTALVRKLLQAERTLSSMHFGWGIGQDATEWGRGLLRQLTLGKNLEAGRVPVMVSATDLLGGKRVVLRDGPAVEALYASSALAGILPPAEISGRYLVDGGYSDIAPVDLAYAAGAERVIVVDPSNDATAKLPRNGIEVMLRAIEICQNEHAHLRFDEADLVLRPKFPVPIGTLEFGHGRAAIASGVRAVREAKDQILRLGSILDHGD